MIVQHTKLKLSTGGDLVRINERLGGRPDSLPRVVSPTATPALRSGARAILTRQPSASDQKLRQESVSWGQTGRVKSPPSTQMVWPVMKSASSLARKTTALPTSRGVPIRLRGVSFDQVPA